MTAQGTRTIIWQGGEHAFCLGKIGLLLQLEDACRAGLATIRWRLENGQWYVRDVRDTIRLGLIGGGLKPEEAQRLVETAVDMNPSGLAPSVLVAVAVVQAVMIGVPDDPVGKPEPAEAAETVSTTTTDAFAGQNSSPSASA